MLMSRGSWKTCIAAWGANGQKRFYNIEMEKSIRDFSAFVELMNTKKWYYIVENEKG